MKQNQEKEPQYALQTILPHPLTTENKIKLEFIEKDLDKCKKVLFEKDDTGSEIERRMRKLEEDNIRQDGVIANQNTTIRWLKGILGAIGLAALGLIGDLAYNYITTH